MTGYRRIAGAAALAVAVSLAAGCAGRTPTIQTGPGAETTFDGLVRVDNTTMSKVWVREDINLSAYDKLMLQVWGHQKPAKARWAFLAEPGYLTARAISTVKETGRGFAPLAVFGSSIVAVLVGILILPGILISVIPGNFAAEVQESVRADAAALGADLTVDCPTPPLLIGDTFTCLATARL